MRASKNNGKQDYLALHDDFHSALDYIVQQSGDINAFDIRVDGEYEGKLFFYLCLELLRGYFRDPHNIKLYGLSSGIIFDSTSNDVYTKLKGEFMKNEASRV